MTVDLQTSASSVGLARAAARTYFDEQDADSMMDIELVVSELVTNAIRHGSGGIALHLALADEGALISVHDGSSQMPVLRQPDRTTPGGRGLHIVNEIAADWGMFPTREGKAVWCLVAVDAPAEGGAA